jgi:anti-sigma regulatory factor (Ser/Thr protein kinase)
MSSLRLNIDHPSQTAEARRRSRALAVEHGFNETAAEKVAIVTTEAATNLLKHAGSGELVLGASRVADSWLIDILALDRGPGMSPIACSVDGYSTSGTPGNGLGAMLRMSAHFDVYSRQDRGTVLLARVSGNGAPPASPIGVHGIQLAMHGEDVSGDQWEVREHRAGLTVVVADGLGHGPDACAAARAAVEALRETDGLSPKDLVTRMHNSMRSTRGAAVGVADLDCERRLARFCGLGNVSARIFERGAAPRSMVSTNGTAGVEARVIREFAYPWPAGSTVVFHSDGLSARWDLADYPGLMTHDPGIIAGVLIRDHCRHTDDVTVVVVK